MEMRDIERSLARWQEQGLVSHDQALAILAFEADEGDEEGDYAPRPALDVGAMLSYGGVLVALGAVVGLYLTVLDGLPPWTTFVVEFLVAIAAVALSFFMSRLGGSAAADALGASAAILVGWTVAQGCHALGWTDGDLSVRFTWFLTALAAALVAWLLAREVPSPLAAAVGAAASAGAVGAFVWLFVGEDDGDVTPASSQVIVIAGSVAAALGVIENGLPLEERARSFWTIGALIATNIVAFLLSASEGGVFEGLLLPYAIVLGVAAVVFRRRALLVFAAIFLYEFVGFVVFRTFGGAMAAIIVLALVGLGTAIGGMAAQRGFGPPLLRRG